MAIQVAWSYAIPADIQSAMKELPQAAARDSFNRALKKSIKIPLNIAKAEFKTREWKGSWPAKQYDSQLAPKKVKFWRTLISKTKRYSKSNVVWGGIGTSGKYHRETSHAWWMEFGVKPHAIEAGKFRNKKGKGGKPTGKKILVGPPPKLKRPRKMLKNKRNVFGPRVQHPGFRPPKIMQNAFQTGGPGMRNTFFGEVRSNMPLVLRQWAKRTLANKVRRTVSDATGQKVKVTVT